MEESKYKMEKGGKSGCYVSQVKGFILLLLALCLAVLVGLVVQLASPGKVQCVCDTPTPEVDPTPNSEMLQQRCMKFVEDGSNTICKACGKLAITTSSKAPQFPSSEPTSTAEQSPSSTPEQSPSPTPEQSPSPTTTQAPKVNYRLSHDVIPLHYVLRLQPEIYGSNSSQFTFNGSVVINVNVTKATSVITLHHLNLDIEERTLHALDGTASSPGIESTSYDNKTQFYNLHLDGDLSVGTQYQIRMAFSGKLRHDGQGVYVSSYTEDNQTVYFVSTQFEAPWARAAFPCFDEPFMKATFDTTLYRRLDTERDYRTLSNEDILESTTM